MLEVAADEDTEIASADVSSLIPGMVAFLRGIGLVVEERPLSDSTFLPGVAIDAGVLVFDAAKLIYPGDLLHEAGHLAVVPADVRRYLTDNAGGDGGEEMAAIAWSYAALVHLGLPLDLLFHPSGYKGEAAMLRENFASGRYIGVPILEWRGMTDYRQAGLAAGMPRYPIMKKWLCD